MNRSPTPKRALAALLAALQLTYGPLVHAATTDLSDTPLANVTGTAAVKPNIMFLLDDSGSMMQQYTPDYVSERWGGPAASDRHCYNSADAPSVNGNRDLCIFGDPPFMSPDFNKQYYNPEISYTPPVNSVGTSYQSQTAANTANWTSVKTDGFNIQNINHFEQNATTFNIRDNYPSRAWCAVQTDDPNSPANNPACVTNATGYFYPTAPYLYGQDGFANFDSSGATSSTLSRAKFRYGNPYYFRILPGEYCSDEALTNCQSVALGGTPPAGFIYPARVRWCTTEARALGTTVASNGFCQSKKVGTYQFARFSITTPATKAYGTIQIGNSGSGNGVTVTQVQVNGVTIMNSTVTAAGGTDTANERRDFAKALADAINNYHLPANGNTNFVACTSTLGTPTTPSCNALLSGVTIAADTVAIIPTATAGGLDYVTDGSYAGQAITVTAPVEGITPASGNITITNSGGGAGTITSITVGPAGGPFVEILNGGLGNFGANSPANRDSAATAVRNRINTYLNIFKWV